MKYTPEIINNKVFGKEYCLEPKDFNSQEYFTWSNPKVIEVSQSEILKLFDFESSKLTDEYVEATYKLKLCKFTADINSDSQLINIHVL